MFDQSPPPSPQENPSSPSLDDAFLKATSTITDFVGGAGADEPEGQASGEVLTPEIPPEMIRAALGPTFNTVFSTIAKIRGNDLWRLDSEEKQALVGVWTPLVSHWLTLVGQGNAALALAVVTTGAVIGGKAARETVQSVQRSKGASKTANTRTPESAASSASSASEVPASPQEQSDSSGTAFE